MLWNLYLEPKTNNWLLTSLALSIALNMTEYTNLYWKPNIRVYVLTYWLTENGMNTKALWRITRKMPSNTCSSIVCNRQIVLLSKIAACLIGLWKNQSTTDWETALILKRSGFIIPTLLDWFIKKQKADIFDVNPYDIETEVSTLQRYSFYLNWPNKSSTFYEKNHKEKSSA